MPDLSLDDLAVFVRVIEHGGFAAAARELRVPTSTVSRAIERLEERADARLLQRTTRSVRATTEGRELFAAIAPSVTALRSAARAVEPATRKPKGRLRVTAPGDLCAAFLADVLVTFTERYPLVQLDFALTNERSNLVAEGFDVAVRAAVRLTDSSLVARKLVDVEHRLYAAPSYLQKHGAPSTLDDLARHRLVVFRAKELARTWTLRGADANDDGIALDVRGSVGGDDFTFVRTMVLAGAGVGLLPHLHCAADEASGRLVRVLADYHARGATLYVVIPSRAKIPARVSAFRDCVVDAFAAWHQ